MTETLHAVARRLGMSGQPLQWTWDVLLDGAVAAYWQHRPVPAPPRRVLIDPPRGRCIPGTAPGYRRHLRLGEVPCDRCRRAAAQVKAIKRLRATAA